jgi:hypothetical protein
MHNASQIPRIYKIPIIKKKKTQNHKNYESLFLRKYKHILERTEYNEQLKETLIPLSTKENNLT